MLLGCPRISPRWELDAIQALIKPQMRGAIEHQNGNQIWSRAASQITVRVWESFAAHANLPGVESPLHLSAAGEFHAVATFSVRDESLARALAVALSTALPDNWWIVGRLFVHGGRFFRRERRIKLKLVPATNVHLPRELRLAVRKALSDVRRS